MTDRNFKTKLKAGEPLLGLWNSLCSPIAAEALAQTGFDWLLFDSEHSPVEISGLVSILQAAAAGASHSVVRVAWNDTVLIKRALDIGADTLLIPFVQNPEEAKAAVAATRYPPEGVRGVAGRTRASGYGLRKDYLKSANNNICVLVQIETEEALKNLAKIAQTSGVDGVFIGPADLSASMGHLGNPEHPDVQLALKGAAVELGALGVPAGILAFDTDQAQRYLDWGYQFVAVGADLGLLVGGAKNLLSGFKYVEQL